VKLKLKDAAYHTEFLFALVQPVVKDRGVTTAMCYTLAPTAKELWEVIVEEDILGSGHTKKTLMAAGWRAVRVFVEEKS
jgi:hypothetical protein